MRAARKRIQDTGVDVRYYSIIYDVIDEVKQVASGLLGIEIREEIVGIAAGARRVPQLQVRRDRRLPGHRGHGQAQQADPRAAQQTW